MSDLCFLTAVELADRIRRRDVSVTEVVRAHLAQIERVNPKVNAIVTLTAERALADAKQKDAALARGEAPGPLFGLPVAHKDLVPTKGIRTTFGSPIYRDNVPSEDGLIIERLRAAGAVTLGKTNTPEFGAGSQTFNDVFGRTLNPYDPSKTCGGSSGGAAVALACGMVPIADGSDTGRSPRNGGARASTQSPREPRMRRRRGAARPARRARDLPGAARLRVRNALRPDAGRAPAPDQGHGDLEHRAGTQADRARAGRGRGQAHRALPSRPAVHGAL